MTHTWASAWDPPPFLWVKCQSGVSFGSPRQGTPSVTAANSSLSCFLIFFVFSVPNLHHFLILVCHFLKAPLSCSRTFCCPGYEIWHLNELLRPFSAFDTLFIQHLRPYSLFETRFNIWDPFHSTFETLFVIWDSFQHLTPFCGHLRPYSLLETLFNMWGLIRYLRPFTAFETLFIQHLRSYWLFERPFSAFDTLLAESAAHR